MKTKNVLLSLMVFLFCFCNASTKAQSVIDTIGNTIVEISVAVDTNHFTGGYYGGPWDLYWGPDNKLWYTDQTRLCTYDPSTQLIDTILQINSGYIMSVTANNDFQNNPFVYLVIDTSQYYGIGNTIQVFRYNYSLTGDSLYVPQFLLQWSHPGEHSGGRIIFGDDDKLYISTAEYYVQYDTLFFNSGKVLRVNPDGTVPSDNPRADFTWSYGHRNPQGIVQVPNGNIFVSEYGMQWDELNLIQANKYYGWMIYDGVSCMGNPDSCSYYDTIAVGPLDAARNPPSGIDFYSNMAIPEFYGLVQAVTGLNRGIIVYTMNNAFDSVMSKNLYLTSEYGRVRDVCTAPDGSLYFIANDRVRAHIRRIQNPLFNNTTSLNRNDEILLFPNPVNDKLYLNFSDKNSDSGILEIYDSAGNCVFEAENYSGVPVNTEKFSNGIYLLKYSGRSVLVKNFVVQH